MKKPDKQQRDLGVKLIFATQYLIDIIDDLKYTTYHKSHIRTKAINLSKDLEVSYGADLKKLFNWNPDLITEINSNFEKFWNHVLNMNPTEISDLVKLLDKAQVKKDKTDAEY